MATESPRNTLAARVLSVTALLLFVIANLPYQYVEAFSEDFGREYLAAETSVESDDIPRIAGWPCSYWVLYRDGDKSVTRYWSLGCLLADCFLAIAVTAIVYGFCVFRFKKINSGSNSRISQFFLDASVAFGILIIPASVVGYSYFETTRHRKIASSLSNQDYIYLSCWVPEVIVDQLPSGLMTLLKRIRTVRTLEANAQQAHAISSLPTLVQWSDHQGDFGTTSVAALSDRVHLKSLEFSGRKLTTDDMSLLGQLRFLTSLGLPHTNLDNEMLKELDGLSRLQSVNLESTRLRLDELGRPGWADSVTVLRLPRPKITKDVTLKLEGWKNLRVLNVFRFDRVLNDTTLTIKLSNLPMLESLFFDRTQKHSLELTNLPRLSAIDTNARFTMSTRLSRNRLVPNRAWIESLSIENLPSLSRLTFFCRDLTTLKLRDTPNLRFLEFDPSLIDSYGVSYAEPIDIVKCKQWIDELSLISGPATIVFDTMDLTGLDMSGLRTNSRIRNLEFPRTQIGFDQLRPLFGIEGLRKVHAPYCKLSNQELTELLQLCPDLESLAFNVSELKSFAIIEKPQLKVFRSTPFNKIEHVRLVDCPYLTCSLQLNRTPKTLEIRNANSLQGLSVGRPWPKNAVIEGLRSINWFEAGGPELDDRIIEPLLQCPKMDRMILAYGSISKQGLQQLGALRRLTVLMVPGADVDDSLVPYWKNIETLWEIDLSDTRAGVGVIAWLSSMASLRSIKLDRVPLDESAFRGLGECARVTHLSLREVEFDEAQGLNLLKCHSLQFLDLSECRVGSTLLEGIAQLPSLEHLALVGSEYDESALNELRSSATNLQIHMEPGSVGSHRNFQQRFPTRRTPDESLQVSSPVPVQRARVQAGFERYRIDIDQFRPQK